MRFKPPVPHRIASLYYFPRTLGFASTFVSACLLYWEGRLSWVVLPFAAVQFLLYPHLMYLRACYAKNSKKAELQSLLIDAFLLGAWAAEFHYMLWLLFTLLMAVCLNNAMNGGYKGAVKAIVIFFAGNVLWASLRGFHFEPNAGLAVTALCIMNSLMYNLNVALVFYRQHQQLTRLKKASEEKNAIFQSLLDVSISNYQAHNIESLFVGPLVHLKSIFPDAGFALILRNSVRPRVIRNLLFDNLDVAEQEWLLRRLLDVDDIAQTLVLRRKDPDGVYHLLPMKGYLRQVEGIFIVRCPVLSDEQYSIITLFLDQMCAAIENQLLATQLKESANTDALTGVFNRTYFNHEWVRICRNQKVNPMQEFSVIMIDVNGLKELNDQYGHDAGDQLIKAVAELLLKACRSTDIVVRLGGDEFAVLCPATNRLETPFLLERIRQAEQATSMSLHKTSGESVCFYPSISLGVASSDEGEPEDMLKLADERMYANKRLHYGGPTPLIE